MTGFWYGKAPGLDRASDAIRHGNLSGTAPLGGAVALVGDDPMAKSSTVPGSSEQICRELWMPVLAPATIEEILEIGLHAVEISRARGPVDGAEDRHRPGRLVRGRRGRRRRSRRSRRSRRASAHAPPVLLSPTNLDAERDLFTARLERVREYALAVG